MPTRLRPRLARLLFLVVPLVPLVAPPRALAEEKPLPVPATETVRLPNGLRVLLAPDPAARLVSVRVTYHAGLGDDPSGLRGLAHMTEHLVADGTKHVPSALATLVSWGAANFNATTSVDATSYFETVPPERLDAVLWLESDRMGFASDAVTRERVESEKANVTNEDLQNRADAALGSLGALTMAELFPPGHPYANTSGAADATFIGARDVQSFLATWYQPANATLAIAGRFDRDAVIASVTRYFGSLPSVPVPTRPDLAETRASSRTLTVRASIPGNRVLLQWRTPKYGTEEDAALDLVAGALAGAGNERLTPALVAAGLATSVGARQRSMKEASVFHIQAQLAPGAEPRKVVAAIDAVLDDFVRTVDDAELARSRAVWRHAHFRGLETSWGRASMLAAMAKMGDDAGPAFDWGLGRYDAVDVAEVARTVATRLVHSRRVIAEIYGDPRAPRTGVLMDRVDVPVAKGLGQ